MSQNNDTLTFASALKQFSNWYEQCCGDVWREAKGGASVANSSHFFVELAVVL